MKLLLLMALAVLGGCAGSDATSPGPHDPANAAASETPWTPPPDRLGTPVGALEATKPPEGGTWTCVMHPEVKSDKPGACPKCGMDLVPVKPEHEEHNHK